MKKSKTQKGITLIALIITIIVLLILAVVAIGAVQNDGIIEYAKNARDQYETAQVKENTALDNYLAKLEENNPNKVVQGSTKCEQCNGDGRREVVLCPGCQQEVEAGDAVRYSKGEIVWCESDECTSIDDGDNNFFVPEGSEAICPECGEKDNHSPVGSEFIFECPCGFEWSEYEEDDWEIVDLYEYFSSETCEECGGTGIIE